MCFHSLLKRMQIFPTLYVLNDQTRTFFFQSDSNHFVRLHLDQAKFPCPGQYFRIRDGDSLGAQLLADVAFDKSPPATGTVISTNQSLLLEFFSDEVTAAGESCVGGFLAHVTIVSSELFFFSSLFIYISICSTLLLHFYNISRFIYQVLMLN